MRNSIEARPAAQVRTRTRRDPYDPVSSPGFLDGVYLAAIIDLANRKSIGWLDAVRGAQGRALGAPGNQGSRDSARPRPSVQIGGPTGAFIVLVAAIVHEHGYDGLALATLMAGGLLSTMGLARLGVLIQFLPYPVTVGFTTGIALIIATGQVGELAGLVLPAGPASSWTSGRCTPSTPPAPSRGRWAWAWAHGRRC